jgi:hypothetical protein
VSFVEDAGDVTCGGVAVALSERGWGEAWMGRLEGPAGGRFLMLRAGGDVGGDVMGFVAWLR